MTDRLLAAFKRIMSMSDLQTALIQVVFYGAGYGLLAIRAVIFIKKYTYKAGILLGLGLYILGALLFYPAKLTVDFYYFLAALWILSWGSSNISQRIKGLGKMQENMVVQVLRFLPVDSPKRTQTLTAQKYDFK